MNSKAIVLAALLVGLFLVGCTSSQTGAGYSTYNQPQQQGGQYVGGGCGVAPSASYEDTPLNALGSADKSL